MLLQRKEALEVETEKEAKKKLPFFIIFVFFVRKSGKI
jgi:hypothetical protein